MELRAVSKLYGSVQALQEVSFTVQQGEVVALLGPNGAGKTTSISIMLGLPKALALQPDVALLDIEMPGKDGLTAAALHAHLPACRVLILTTFGRPGYLRRAMESGAVGFLVKDAPAGQLAVAGERIVDPALAATALNEGSNPLTTRERAVLATSARGASIAEIATTLFLSEGTVRNHLSTAIQKLGAQNRVEAAHFAEQKGWLEPR